MPWIKNEEPDPQALVAQLLERIERLEQKVLLLQGDVHWLIVNTRPKREDEIPF